MTGINAVSIVLACVFFIPILMGFFISFSRERIQHAIASLIENLEFLGSIILSVYLTKKVFFENSSGIFKTIYDWIPMVVREMLYGRDVLTYIMVVPIVLLLIITLLRLFTNPLYKAAIGPLSTLIYSVLSSMNFMLRRTLSALCQLPKALYMALLLGIVLNFFNYYFPAGIMSKWMNESKPYQILYRNVINPVLNSNIAKQIPVIVNDSFARTIGKLDSESKEVPQTSDLGKLAEQLTGGKIKIIEYFNGVTLDEAVKSSEEIDRTAKKIVGNEKNSRKKAYLIYKWITDNVKYDYVKAQKISSGVRDMPSGAIPAFETKMGICFDYSSLYIAMCRAVELKVRLVTGLGYSGLAWGDHAWNQVLDEDAGKWINVDTTFGVVGNYFDKQDFNVDHKYAEVQGEW